MFKRTVFPFIKNHLFQRKALIIYGARQVGKTTLLKEFQKTIEHDSLFLNCDEPDIADALSQKTSTQLKRFLGNHKLILIDEAQRIKNIGITIKLLVDQFPEMQIIATGSSAFELSNKIIEPLTGRKFEFYLYPFSIEELNSTYTKIELHRILSERLVFGMYPQVVLAADNADRILKEITNSYLFKDMLQYQNIRNADLLKKLLQALALQIGSEVSYTELAGLLGIDRKTIEHYIHLLEKSFIIFRLNPFSNNQRNELKKMRKIYFYDNGIRNALIQNLNPIQLRQDVGSLWENFIISERIKHNQNHLIDAEGYFWRNHQHQEIDYIEQLQNQIKGYKLKWMPKPNLKAPKSFLDFYPNASFEVIHSENYLPFLGIQ